MKKIAKGIHRLSQRAAEIREVMQAMPAQAAELREAVTATAGQMRQLRTDLTTAVPPRLPENESAALAQLRKIEVSADALAEAGYRLGGIDHDLGAGRRTRVLLERVDAVALPRLYSLLAMETTDPTTKALLAAIVQATELAAKVEFAHLIFTEILVEIGSGQAVRIGWRTADPVASAPVVAAEARPPTFSQSSFFARPAATPTPAAPVPEPAPVPSAPAQPAAAAPLEANWRASALDRFKKMPDLSKRTVR